MPVVGSEEIAAINMFRRCKEWGTLPREGGLFDQNEVEMGMLDVIAEELEAARQKKLVEEELRRKHGR
jgi:hypothetical protein